MGGNPPPATANMFASEHSAFEPYRRPLRATAAPFVPQLTSPLVLLPSAVYAGMQEPRMGPRLRVARIRHQMDQFQAGVAARKDLKDLGAIKRSLSLQVEQLRLSILRALETFGTISKTVRCGALLRMYHFLLDHPYVYEGCGWFKSDLRTLLEEFHNDCVGSGELGDAEGLLWSVLG
jgi:hypothetical protein